MKLFCAHSWSYLFRLNTLRPRQNACHSPNDIFECISCNEDLWISLKISLKFVTKVPINNIPVLVQLMAFSEHMTVTLLTQICTTRPQWVNYINGDNGGIMAELCRKELWWLLENFTNPWRYWCVSHHETSVSVGCIILIVFPSRLSIPDLTVLDK